MTQKSRELLLIRKFQDEWQSDFEKQVDELMLLVEQADKASNLLPTVEVADLYQNKMKRKPQKLRQVSGDQTKPFVFSLYKN
jgi:hypothetical protein